MSTASVLPEQNTIVAEIFIAAPRERVFQAITDPKQMPLWWGQEGMYRITEWKGDLRVGGKWSSVGAGADGSPFRVDGEYLTVDPPRQLVHTWIASWNGDLKTVVRWDLEEQTVHGLQAKGPHKMGTGTRVRLTHEGFGANQRAAANHAEGWKRVLGWAQAFLERGETAESRKA